MCIRRTIWCPIEVFQTIEHGHNPYPTARYRTLNLTLTLSVLFPPRGCSPKSSTRGKVGFALIMFRISRLRPTFPAF